MLLAVICCILFAVARLPLLIAALLLTANSVPADTASSPLIALSPDEVPPTSGKYLHFLGGMAAGLAFAGIFQSVTDPQFAGENPLYLPAVALSAALVAGVSKEILDSTGFGDPRFTDVLITMAGGIAAAAAVGYAGYLYPHTQTGTINSVDLLFSTAALLAVPVAIGFWKEIEKNRERNRSAITTAQ